MDSITNTVISLLLFFSTSGDTIFGNNEVHNYNSTKKGSYSFWLLPKGFLDFDTRSVQRDSVITTPDSLQTDLNAVVKSKK